MPLIVPRPCRGGLIVPYKHGNPPLVVPDTGCLQMASSGLISVEVNSPDLGGFTAVAKDGSIDVGTIFNSTFFPPGLPGWVSVMIRVNNGVGEGDLLVIDPPDFTLNSGFGTGFARLDAPFASPLAEGGSDEATLEIASSVAPGPFSVTVSIENSQADCDPFTFEITGVLGFIE